MLSVRTVPRPSPARARCSFESTRFYDIERAEHLIQRYGLGRGAEVARLDHCNIRTPDIPAAHAHDEHPGPASAEPPAFGFPETGGSSRRTGPTGPDWCRGSPGVVQTRVRRTATVSLAVTGCA